MNTILGMQYIFEGKKIGNIAKSYLNRGSTKNTLGKYNTTIDLEPDSIIIHATNNIGLKSYGFPKKILRIIDNIHLKLEKSGKRCLLDGERVKGDVYTVTRINEEESNLKSKVNRSRSKDEYYTDIEILE